MRDVWRLLATSLAIALGGAGACVLQLDDEISCGDGFLDERAGEECDPAVPSSFENGCEGTSHPMGDAECDPFSCRLINTAEKCAVCGDSIVDASQGEQCDSDNLNGQACPGGNGALQCSETCQFDFTECDACGNGVVDDGEECDYNSGNGGFVTPRECAGSNLGTVNEIPPLASPIPGKPYTSGQTSLCRTDCRFERVGCGFCGDGVRDDAIAVQNGVTVAAEWCDGDSFDDNRLLEVLGPLCDDPITSRPNVVCGDDCRSFDELAGGCCLRRNASCPDSGIPGGGGPEDDELRCCHEFAFPDEADCYNNISANDQIVRLCR